MTLIDDPIDYFGRRWLHDYRIDEMRLDVRNKTAYLKLIDYSDWSNDIPEREGLICFLFTNCLSITIDVQFSEGIRINDHSISQKEGVFCLSMDLNLGFGRFSREIKNISIEFHSMKLLND